MKRILCLVLFFSTLAISQEFTGIPNQQASGSVRGEGGPLGLGVLLGDPFGISGKYYVFDNQAIVGGVGYGYSEEDGFQTQFDYVWHPHVIGERENLKFSWYLGLGAALLIGDDSALNMRFPVGFQTALTNQSLDFFIEAVPGLELIDDPDFAIDFAAGTRFYF